MGFRIGDYDRQRPLVIDPVLDYATYYGGAGSDSVNAIAVDAEGNAFVAGESLIQRSPPFPVCPGGQPCPTSDVDAIVSKIDPTGSTVLWTDIIGGSGTDVAHAIALDSQGNVFVAGSTTSTSLPTGIGFDPTCGADGTCGEQTFQIPRTDGFVMKLAPNSVFESGSYLGGDLEDAILALAVDPSGVYVTGRTDAFLNDFPLVNPVYSTPLSGAGQPRNIFVTKFSPDLSQLAYSTLFGRGTGFGIAVNALGEAFVVGETTRLAFSTPNAFQTNSHDADAYLIKLSADGGSVPYATYLHGASDPPETAFAVALDSAGVAHLTGEVFDDTFPVVNAVQPTIAGGGDAFVAIIDTSLFGPASLVYSSFLGGGGEDVGRAIAVDAVGNVYVAGHTKNDLSAPGGPQFPLANPLRPCLDPGIDADGNWRDFDNPFLAVLHPANPALLFSTCLGSDTERDRALALALDPSGSAYLGGWTRSAQFPVTPGAPGPTYDGNQDGFVAKLSELVGPGPLSISVDDVQAGESNSGTTPFTFTVTLSRASANPVTVDFATTDGTATLADNDYAAKAGTVTFAVGETTKTIAIDVTGDETFETDETFFVDLANAFGATISKVRGLGTIQNDDPDTVTINIQETISVTDAPGVLPSAMLNISEAITVTDVPGLLPSAMLSINEAITVTDAPGVSVANTPIGPDVVVVPMDVGTGTAPVTITFATVVQVGETTLVIGPAGPPPPAGFVHGTPPLYYEVGTTAVFTGTARVCVSYAGVSFRGEPGLWHFSSGAWTNITTSVDTVNQVVCGMTDSFSPFALFEPAPVNQPPTLALPSVILVNATSAEGAVVTFTATASDPEDGALTVTCVPASGSTFVIGTTSVACSATDSANASVTGSFTVTVNPLSLGVPRITSMVVAKGRDAAGNFYMDLLITNTGSGPANNMKIFFVLAATLSGHGTVTYNPTLSGRLPLSLGSLAAGASTTQRIFLRVPATVNRFFIVETGVMQNADGHYLPLYLWQVVDR